MLMVALFTTSHTIGFMARLTRVSIGLAISLLILPFTALAEEPFSPSVLIVEIQTGSNVSASEEFIELFNVSDEVVDLSNWRLEYYSAGVSAFSSPTRTIALSGMLGKYSRYLLASNDYLPDTAHVHFSATLAKSGGHLRLVRASAQSAEVETHDVIGWGTATLPEAKAAQAPPEGNSLERRSDENGAYLDTNDNSQDFILNATPSPQADELLPPPEEPSEEPATPPETTETEETPATEESTDENTPQTAITLVITELLPNPAPPGSDSNDEYVELYNPNDEPVVLAGYQLQTGSTYSYSYVFDDVTIPARGYLAVMSSETNLVLANTKGQARLLGPNGEVISTTEPYENANDGEAWALVGETWQWTLQPTPAAENVLKAPVVSTTKAAAKKASAKKTAAKKTATKAAKTTGSAPSRSDYEEPESASQVAPIHPLVLAAIGGLGVVYAAYEYRHDVANAFHKFRTNRATRRATRQAA